MMQRNSGATESIILGYGSTGVVSRWIVQVKGSGWTGTLTAKARAEQSGLASADWKNIPYTDRTTGNTVVSGTAISADGLFEFDASGVDIILSHAWTAGTVTLYCHPVVG